MTIASAPSKLLRSELRATIQNVLPSGDYVPAEQADRIMMLLESDFLDRAGAILVRDLIMDILAEIRLRQRSVFQSAIAKEEAAFGKLVAKWRETGDISYLKLWDAHFKVDERNTQRRFADMTGSDHQFVAGNYERTGKRALRHARFHYALAELVGDHKTAEVVDIEQVASLLETTIIIPEQENNE